MTASQSAETVTVSYPADLSDWGRDTVEGGPRIDDHTAFTFTVREACDLQSADGPTD